jgi:hypothetical protein
MFEGIQGMNSLEFPHTSLEGMISLIHYFLNLREYSPVQQEREYSLRHSVSGEGIIFRVYVRPILEYNSIIWSPNLIHLIDLIENVQRNFTKRIPSLSSLPYTERLALLDLNLLELRRLRFDLIYYYKVLNNLTPFDPSEVFSVYTPSSWSRSDMSHSQKPIKGTNRLLSTFFFRSIDAWNALPAALRSSASLPVFKRHLKQFDLSAYLKGSARHLCF